MPSLQERLDALVTTVIAPTLKARGYAKRRLTWQRTTAAASHEISLQRSQGNRSEHLRLYVELGAFVPEFARAIGADVPENLAKATPHYRARFEDVVDWPGQWIDLEQWEDSSLHAALRTALIDLDAHLAALTSASSVVAAKQRHSAGLDLDLFAWWCAAGDRAAMAAQIAAAQARFGAEPRWPRLFAQFERVAARHGVPLT